MMRPMDGWCGGMALALALPALGCGQEIEPRPTGTFRGSFSPPPAGGGTGGEPDAGVGDGGETGRTVSGRVVELSGLDDFPDIEPGAPGRQVGAYAPDGSLVTTISDEDGAFELSGLTRVRPARPLRVR